MKGNGRFRLDIYSTSQVLKSHDARSDLTQAPRQASQLSVRTPDVRSSFIQRHLTMLRQRTFHAAFQKQKKNKSWSLSTQVYCLGYYSTVAFAACRICGRGGLDLVPCTNVTFPPNFELSVYQIGPYRKFDMGTCQHSKTPHSINPGNSKQQIFLEQKHYYLSVEWNRFGVAISTSPKLRPISETHRYLLKYIKQILGISCIYLYIKAS